MADDIPNTSSIDSTGIPASDTMRKLAAIMFTDVKGFSRKMGKDEAATMRMLASHNQIMDESVAKHGGHVIKTVGDAYLVSFESVVNASHCAFDIQKRLHEHNEQATSEDEKIVIRIGVHLGDVIVKDKDVFGDGVNIAARIQSLTSPGGVCISEDAARQMRGKLDYPMLKLGKGALKNIEMPVTIYKVILPWQKEKLPIMQQIQFVWKQRKARAVAGIAAVVGVGAVWLALDLLVFSPPLTDADKSLAVLPFVNAGGAENEYLADGITRDLTTNLAKLPKLLVISSRAAFQFKKTSLSDSSIAAELNVRFLLKGSIHISGSAVKIQTVLHDAHRNTAAFQSGYDVQRKEIFGVEGNIVREVAGFFDTKKPEQIAESRTANADAYEMYLRGRYYLAQVKKDGNALAIEYFTEAQSKDPGFLDATVYLAHAQQMRFEYGWDRSESVLAESERICRSVLSRDPKNAEALRIVGALEIHRGNHKKAAETFQEVLKLDPNNQSALSWLGWLNLAYFGEPAKAVAYLKRVREIEPTYAPYNSNLGIAYAYLKNYPEAISAFRRAIRLNPEDDLSWINIGYSYERLVKYDSAVANYSTALKKNPANPLVYQSLVDVLLTLGRYAVAESVLTSGSLMLSGDHRIAYSLGVTYALRGKASEARRELQNGLRLLDGKIRKNPSIGEYHADAALFHARLGDNPAALAATTRAMQLDSTNSDVVIKIARTFAILGKKEKVLEFFQRAKLMNPEYDAAYLATATDFERFRKNPDLQLIARQE